MTKAKRQEITKPSYIETANECIICTGRKINVRLACCKTGLCFNCLATLPLYEKADLRGQCPVCNAPLCLTECIYRKEEDPRIPKIINRNTREA